MGCFCNSIGRPAQSRLPFGPRTRVVVDGDLRVEDQPTPSRSYSQRERVVVEDLCSTATQTLVELQALDGGQPERHVHSLEDVDASCVPDASLVSAYDPPEPLHLANHRHLTAVDSTIRGVQPITTPDTRDRWVGLEVSSDASAPVGPGRGIIIGYGDDIGLESTHLSQSLVERSNLAGQGYWH